MKHIRFFACISFLSVFLMQGCNDDKYSDFEPLSGGFGLRKKWVGVDTGPNVKLYYKDDKSGKLTLIWPFFATGGGDIAIKDDMAIFVADIPDPKGRLGSHACFAAQGCGPALDISQDVLFLWAKAKGLDFNTIKYKYGPLEGKEQAYGFQVHYIGDENLPMTFFLNWQQISNIIQDVKINGKERRFKLPEPAMCLKKDYDGTNDSKIGGK